MLVFRGLAASKPLTVLSGLEPELTAQVGDYAAIPLVGAIGANEDLQMR